MLEQKQAAPAAFDQIATEYYDSTRHPTCANFETASVRLLRDSNLAACYRRRVLEVGSGRSVVAKLFRELGASLSQLLLTDASAAMLSYSADYAKLGARTIVAEADRLPVSAQGVGVLVSSLGDPYNRPAFWREAFRILAPGGIGFFTTPSYEWARSFRRMSSESAGYELRDGTSAFFPSFIYAESHQRSMIESAGFLVTATRRVDLGVLAGHVISPKLLCHGTLSSIVTLYQFEKPKTLSREKYEHA